MVNIDNYNQVNILDILDISKCETEQNLKSLFIFRTISNRFYIRANNKDEALELAIDRILNDRDMYEIHIRYMCKSEDGNITKCNDWNRVFYLCSHCEENDVRCYICNEKLDNDEDKKISYVSNRVYYKYTHFDKHSINEVDRELLKNYINEKYYIKEKKLK
jgi:hypothetical protein